jgi:signal transduction histidine kinase
MRYLCQRISERIEAQISERLHISRDLHDTLMQGVQGITLSFHALAEQLPKDATLRKKMMAALDRAEEVIAEGRDRIGALRFEGHSQRSIRNDIIAIGEQNNADEAIDFKGVVKGKETALRSIVLEEMSSICREALNNAFRHADARTIEVILSFGSPQFSVVVRDDGSGIDKEVVNSGAATGHWGIIGMRERATRLGARFEVRNATKLQPNPGTELEIQLPARAAYLRAPKRITSSATTADVPRNEADYSMK